MKKVSKQEWSSKEINFVLTKHQAGYSRHEISKMFTKHFVKDSLTRTQDSIKHCIETHGQHIEKDIPRVLFFDVETSPHKAYVWQQYDNNIDLPMLIQDGSILSFSAKWAGDDDSKTMYFDQRGKERNLQNDKALVLKLWKLLDEADIVCGHNVRKFDLRKVNARFIVHGLGPTSDYKVLDTLTMSRSTFGFFSNKLAHLSAKLAKKHKKDSHNDFPGFSLWDQCMKGNVKAWNSMKKYNILDTLALEEVFLKLSKYVKNNKVVTAALRNYKK